MTFDQLIPGKGVEFDLPQQPFTLQFLNDSNHVVVKVAKSEPDAETEIISQYVVLNVTGAQASRIYDGDIVVKESDGVGELGMLCIADGSDISISELTEFKVIAVHLDWLRSELESDLNFSSTSSFRIENSYLFVHIDKYEEYQGNYKEGAPIWGGFSHSEPNEKHQDSISEISAVKGIKMPTFEHEMKLSKIISSSDGFERFLSKYHLLELLYDYVCVAKLRSVTEVKDFRDIMTSYGREEIKNLKSLIIDYVSDISGLLDIIPKIIDYEASAVDIFQNHSKDSNPLKSGTSWDKFITVINSNKLTCSNMSEKDARFISGIEQEPKFREVILNICSYWIYRIRCSIAHNKIGEYIFSNEDEKFVILFGEKILDEVIKQLFTDSELVALMAKSKLIDDM